MTELVQPGNPVPGRAGENVRLDGGDDGETPAGGQASQAFSAIATSAAPRLSLDELCNRLGDRTFGIVLLMLATMSCMPLPPGVSSVIGVTMMLVAVQLAFGCSRLWLPGFLRRRSVARDSYRRALPKVLPTLRRVEALCRPRVSWLTRGAFERLIGLIVLILAFVITLPIPVIGNIPPGIAVAVLSLSLIERDGLAACCGTAIGVAAFALNAGVVGGTVVAAASAAQRLLP